MSSLLKVNSGFVFKQDQWTEFKNQAVTMRSLPLYYWEDADIYTVYAIDGPILFHTDIYKGTVPTGTDYTQVQNDADKADFVTNYLPTANATRAGGRNHNPSGAVLELDFYSSVSMGVVPNTSMGTVRGITTVSSSSIAQVTDNAYTEQSSNAQRSLVSTSANDASAGTGARTVRIVYYSMTAGIITGPFVETVTMNGVTPVDTVSTAICHVKSLEVITAGSGDTNAGTIQMYSATAGGGSVFTSIPVNNSRTNTGIHWIPNGKTMLLKQLRVSTTAAAGQTPTFSAKFLAYNVPNAATRWIYDKVLAAGGQNELIIALDTPFAIPANSKLTMYVTPSSATTITAVSSLIYVEL